MMGTEHFISHLFFLDSLIANKAECYSQEDATRQQKDMTLSQDWGTLLKLPLNTAQCFSNGSRHRPGAN